MHGFVVCKTILAIHKSLSIYLINLIKYFKIYLAVLETANTTFYLFHFFYKILLRIMCIYIYTNIINNIIITKLIEYFYIRL